MTGLAVWLGKYWFFGHLCDARRLTPLGIFLQF
jgi:hypothetical protein